MVCEASTLIWLSEVLSSNSPAIWYISSITAGILIYGLQLGVSLVEFILRPAWGF